MKLYLSIILLLLSCTSVYGQEKYSDEDDHSFANNSIEQLFRQKEYIYARHGYSFESDSSTVYFKRYDWYKPIQRNSFIRLTDREEKQVSKINKRIEGLFQQKINFSEDAKSLNKEEIKKQISSRTQFNIGMSAYEVSYVFPYEDRSGRYKLILGESAYNHYSKTQDKAIFKEALKAVLCKEEGGYLLKQMELEDKVRMKGNLFDIRFLPYYTLLEDVDGDGLVDPIFVYTTYGINGHAQGRTGICLIYKSDILEISVQNDVSKDESLISGSSNIRFLPEVVRLRLIRLIEQLQKDGICVLNETWSDIFEY